MNINSYAQFENLMQMRADHEWASVWAIMLSHLYLSDAEKEKLITEDDQLEAYEKWLAMIADLRTDAVMEAVENAYHCNHDTPAECFEYNCKVNNPG